MDRVSLKKMTAVHGTIASVWLFLFPLMAGAQQSAESPEDEDPDIFLSINVGYNTAYRSSSWVPVDVLVHNELSDLSGWVEVRKYGVGNELLSPVYRVPAECPEGSRKLFRLYCYLNPGVTRIEAWLYENGLPAVDVPAYTQLRPIEARDALGLVLDDSTADDTANFAFLYESMSYTDSLFSAEKPKRFFRHGVGTRDLASLPGYAECYDAFNVIVLGDIDPSRVSRLHRRHIREYVERSGTLVVMTGIHSAAYRGTWVEELMGVELGELEHLDESALARAVFPRSKRRGSRDSWECALVELRPVVDGLELRGTTKTLVAINRIGRGQVCTFAVDASTQTLQKCVGYQELWHEFLTATRRPPDLDFDQAAIEAARQLPRYSGVTIRSSSSVMLYLLLYLGVGIVGNWLFWSWRKRREMAWVCLAFFSVAFTAYAVVSGTSGWAKSAEVQGITVVRVLQGAANAEYDGLFGILTARTAKYSAALDRDTFLVRDAEVWKGYRQAGRGLAGLQAFAGLSPPFTFYSGESARIEDFRVGASEMRFTHVQGRRPIAGHVTGQVRRDPTGIRGTLVNETGIPLEFANLLWKGVAHPLEKKGDGVWTIDAQLGVELWGARRTTAYENLFWNERKSQSNLFAITSAIAGRLFYHKGEDSFAPHHGPYLVGWAEAGGGGESMFRTEGLERKLSETLLVAEVDVVDLLNDYSSGRTQKIVYELEDWNRTEEVADEDDPVRTWRSHKKRVEIPVVVQCEVNRVPSPIELWNGALELDLFWRSEDPEVRMYLLPRNSDLPPVEHDYEVSRRTYEIDGGILHQTSYRIEAGEIRGWANLPALPFTIVGIGPERDGVAVEFHLRARLLADSSVPWMQFGGGGAGLSGLGGGQNGTWGIAPLKSRSVN